MTPKAQERLHVLQSIHSQAVGKLKIGLKQVVNPRKGQTLKILSFVKWLQIKRSLYIFSVVLQTVAFKLTYFMPTLIHSDLQEGISLASPVSQRTQFCEL